MFIEKILPCDEDVMKPKELITHEFLVKEATRKYHNLFD